MAKTYLATQDALTATNTQVSNLQTVVQDPTGGIEARVTKNESDIANIESTVGADDAAGLRKRIKDNETAIGDNSGGVIKRVNDLESIVGTDNTQGLQKRTVDLEAKTENLSYNDTTKRLKQAEAATEVASDDNDVLLKSDVPVTKTEVTYDATAKRLSVVNDATATASDDKHVLTKKDTDALYQPIGAALEGITLPSRGIHSLDPGAVKDTEIFKFETLAPLDAGVPTTVSVYASTGSEQVKFYLSSRVPYFAKFQGTRAVTTRTNGEVKGSDGTVVYAAARRWVSGTTGHATAQKLTTNAFDREDCVSLIMQFGKGGGDAHKFSCSCQIELTPVDSGSMNLTVTPLSGKQQP